MRKIPVGTIVVLEAPSSRNDNNETREMPAIVTYNWPDGSVQLFCFHFEGSFLMNSVPQEHLKPVGAIDLQMAVPIIERHNQKFTIDDPA